MTNSAAIVAGGSVDELLRGQGTETHSKKGLKLAYIAFSDTGRAHDAGGWTTEQ
jgi:hypothetical protein